MSEDNRDFIYTIPQSVLEDSMLNGTDLRIYMYVRSFMHTTKDAYFSNRWAAKRLNVDPLTVSRSISKLIKRKHLVRVDINGKRHMTAGLVGMKDEDEGIQKDQGGVDLFVKGGVDENVNQLDQRSIISKSTNNLCISKNLNKKELSEVFDKLWEYYPVKKGRLKAYTTFLQLANGKPRVEVERLAKDIWNGIVGLLQEHRWLREAAAHESFKVFVPELPHGATWFTQERWNDTYETDPIKFLANIRAKGGKK